MNRIAVLEGYTSPFGASRGGRRGGRCAPKRKTKTKRRAGGKRQSKSAALRAHTREIARLMKEGRCAEAFDQFDRFRAMPSVRGQRKALNTLRKKFVRGCMRF